MSDRERRSDLWGVMRGLLHGLTTACLLAACVLGIAAVLGGVSGAPMMEGANASGITIPIRPLVAPLRRGEAEQTPVELRRTIPELPRKSPQQRLRKPARTQFADMDLASRAG